MAFIVRARPNCALRLGVVVPGVGAASTVAAMTAAFDAVLFDVDDTLYCVSDLVVAMWRRERALLESWGVDPDVLAGEYESRSRTVPYQLLLGKVVDVLGYDIPPAKLAQVAASGVPDELPCPAATRAGLRALRAAGVRLGAVTNGDTCRQLSKLSALGVLELFDVVVCCGDDVAPKPSPDGFLLAAQSLGVTPQRTVMVGDRPEVDLAPALGLGMSAIRVTGGNYWQVPSLPGCVAELSRGEELWAKLAEITGADCGLAQVA